MSPIEYENIMSALGSPIKHVLQEYALPGHGNIVRLTDYVPPEGSVDGITDGGSYWHSDMSYYDTSNILTSLYAVNASRKSSCTQFIDLQDGWKCLVRNDELCNKIERLTGAELREVNVVHRFGNRRKSVENEQPEQYLSPGRKGTICSVVHPLIKNNIFTGKSSLYAISGSSVCFEGVDELTSRELLNELEDYVIHNSMFYEHKYETGDLVIWDNSALLHRGNVKELTKSYESARILWRMNVDYSEVEL